MRRETSDWFAVTQDMIDQFCTATGDNDWMHVDPERARRESPYGGIIAPGFWTLSMLPHLRAKATGDDFRRARAGNQLRLRPGPVSRSRAESARGSGWRSSLLMSQPANAADISSERRTPSRSKVANKPALVAEWLFLLVYR